MTEQPGAPETAAVGAHKKQQLSAAFTWTLRSQKDDGPNLKPIIGFPLNLIL